MFDDHTKTRGFAHDINGLICSLMLIADRLDEQLDPDIARQARRITKISERISKICRQELSSDITRRGIHAHSENTLRTLLTEIDAAVAPERTGGAAPYRFDVFIDGDAALTCSTSALFRILFNLIKNAAAALSQPEDASRRNTPTAPTSAVITVQIIAGIDTTLLRISDNGPGLPEQVLSYLYPRTDKPQVQSGRIGSGLVTSVQLATSMGGALHLVNSAETGTTFELALPSTAPICVEVGSGFGRSKTKSDHSPAAIPA